MIAYRYTQEKNLTENDFKHMAHTVGVEKISKNVYDYSRTCVVDFLENILERAYLYNDIRKKKGAKTHILDTLSIILALRSSKYDIKLIAGTSEIEGKVVKLSGGGNKLDEKKFIFRKGPFERLVKEIIHIFIHKKPDEIKITIGAKKTLQQAVESYMLYLFSHSNFVKKERPTLFAEDMMLVRKLRGE